MNAAANLHAIWLDDLAPGEGSTPIWDALYAEQDAETQRVVFNACADEHTEPVAVEANGFPSGLVTIEGRVSPEIAERAKAKTLGLVAAVEAAKSEIAADVDRAVSAVLADIQHADATRKPRKKPAKKPDAKKATPRKKPSVLTDAEAKLAGVKARVKAQTDELGGAS